MAMTREAMQFSRLNTNKSQLNWDNRGLINLSELSISATGGLKEGYQTVEKQHIHDSEGRGGWGREGNKQNPKGKRKVSSVPDEGDGSKFCLTRLIVWLSDLGS